VGALKAEAARKQLTAYRLAQETGLQSQTVQRLLDGKGSPTLATVETVAAALGMVVEIRLKRS
jgi:DNA-binding phage protein